MLEPTQKKRIILLAALLIALIIGGAVWALLVNRVNVTFIAKAPYEIEISNGKKLACPQNECHIVLAPGIYSAKIIKEGYREGVEEFSVTSGSQPVKQLSLQFIPTLKELSTSEADIFTQPKFTDEQLRQLPTKEIFYDEEAVFYLTINKQTSLQTLYSRTHKNGILEAEIALTSFQRPFKNHLIFPNLKEQKVIIIDSPDQNATLYFVDIKNKTRTNLLNFPSIKDVMWLTGGSDFLVQARDENTVADHIFRYSFQQQRTQKLPFTVSLKNIVSLDSERLIFATDQLKDDSATLEVKEGKLLDLENENILLSPDQATSFSFIDFSLVSLQGRLIKNFPEMALPESLILSNDRKEILFKSGEKYYQLRISE